MLKEGVMLSGCDVQLIKMARGARGMNYLQFSSNGEVDSVELVMITK